MDTELMLDVGQAQELKLAFRKHGWTNAEIKRLSEGDFLGQFLLVMRGQAKIVVNSDKLKEPTPKEIVTPSALNCTKPLDPTAFISQGWSVWKGPIDGDGLSGEEDVDPRSLALITLDPAKFLFETCLIGKETSIKGEEKLKRLKEKANLIRFGGNVFLALWEDYQVHKENSILEWLYRTKKITYLDFFGMILRSPGALRCVLYLCRDDGGQWSWVFSWLDDGWNGHDFSWCVQVL